MIEFIAVTVAVGIIWAGHSFEKTLVKLGVHEDAALLLSLGLVLFAGGVVYLAVEVLGILAV